MEAGFILFLDKTKLNVGEFSTQTYIQSMIKNMDWIKIAGGVRFTMDLSDEDIKNMEAVLRSMDGHIYWGISKRDAMSFTCLVENAMKGKHIHFVDGAWMGYWDASNQIKEKRQDAASKEGGVSAAYS